MRWLLLSPLTITLLSATPALADDVSVVGDRPLAPRASRDAAVPSTVIDGARLHAPGVTAAEVLRGAPGVSVVDGGAGAVSTAAVRGATSAQTPVYVAGIRVNDDVGGTADLTALPLFAMERVEIYRGHAPLVADRLGIGGAIFFDPRRARRTELAYGATVGSFGARESRLRASVGDSDASALFALRTSRQTHDFEYLDDGGTAFDARDDRVRQRRNADTSIVDAWAIGRAPLPRGGRLDVLASHAARDAGVPGNALSPAVRARSHASRTLLAARGHLGERDGVEVSLGTSALSSSARYDDPYFELALGAPSATVSGSRLEQAADVRAEVGTQTVLRADARLAHERLTIDAADSQAARRIFSRAGGALTTRLGESARLDALAAIECHGTSTGDAARACDTVAPSARAMASASYARVTAYGGAGRYTRVPTLGERFGVSGPVRGNPSLTPERGEILDAGIRADRGSAGGLRGSIELALFAQWTRELVTYERSSLGFVRPYNTGAARTLGAELDARAELSRHLSAWVAATALDPRVTTEDRAGDLVPFRARLTVAPTVRAATGPWGALDELAMTLRGWHQASRVVDRRGLVVLPAQQRLDAEAEATLLDERLRIAVRLANALGARLVDTLGYPLPGRAYFASFEVVAR